MELGHLDRKELQKRTNASKRKEPQRVVVVREVTNEELQTLIKEQHEPPM